VTVARGRLGWIPVHTALAVFVSIQIVTTLANASAWLAGLHLVTIYVLGFGCFAAAATLMAEPADQRRAARTWIAAGVVLALAGSVATAIANLWQVDLWGARPLKIWPPGLEDRPTPYGALATFKGTNLFASFLLLPLALALWEWAGAAPGSRRRWAATCCAGAIALGLAFSQTRAAWIAAALIALLWWRITGARGGPRLVLSLAAAALAALTLMTGWAPVAFRTVARSRRGTTGPSGRGPRSGGPPSDRGSSSRGSARARAPRTSSACRSEAAW
jgi:hypothetical protein